MARQGSTGMRGREGDNCMTTITICVLPRARGAQGAMQDVNGEADSTKMKGHEGGQLHAYYHYLRPPKAEGTGADDRQ